jgi:SAM-dependent methyltransferase
MAFVGYVDVMKETQISGWAADDLHLDTPAYVDILVGSVRVASVRCCLYREDLRHAGLGDGRKAFFFDPSQYLAFGPNAVEVRFSESESVVPNGSRSLIGTSSFNFGSLDGVDNNYLLTLSQERWKGSEEDWGLTWGQVMTGDSFLDALEKQYTFRPDHHVCEIGPGYGRLLKTILGRSLPFARYTGIELSQERVNRLSTQFASERIEFICADANDVHLPRQADLIICSATFEHLFPDFSRALDNLVNVNLSPGGSLAIDFIQIDDAMKDRWQAFEPNGHAFVRVYSSDEINDYFARCGLTAELSSIVLGKGASGDVRRILVFARRLSPGSGPLKSRPESLSASLPRNTPCNPPVVLDESAMEARIRAVDLRLNNLSMHVCQLQDRMNRYANVLPIRWMRRLRATIHGFRPPP